MESNNNPQKLKDSELLKDLEQVVDELGHAPTKKEYNNNGNHGSRTYLAHFGTWGNAMDKIGIDYDSQSNDRVNKEQILNEIEKYVQEHDEVPSGPGFNNFADFSLQTVYAKFESWSNAVVEAGYKPKNNVPEDVMLMDLVELAEKLDKAPTRKEYDEHGTYQSQSILHKFEGEWQVLAKEAYQIAVGGL